MLETRSYYKGAVACGFTEQHSPPYLPPSSKLNHELNFGHRSRRLSMWLMGYIIILSGVGITSCGYLQKQLEHWRFRNWISTLILTLVSENCTEFQIENFLRPYGIYGWKWFNFEDFRTDETISFFTPFNLFENGLSGGLDSCASNFGHWGHEK